MKKLCLLLLLELAFVRGVEAQGRTYTTNFPLTENPISEGGNWINGQTAGLDWMNVRTTPGRAFGADASGTPNYNDPTALLTGAWGPNQTVQATVFTVNQKSGSINEEVELRLRSAISAHSNTGYEILFRCVHNGSQYVEIVRWNGPRGNFTYIQRVTGPGLNNGDVVKATIVGNVITGYINGTQVIQGTDSTFAAGNPGMGFYLSGASGLNGDFGFTSFTASDAGTSPPGTPTSPNPANGSTGVGTTPTLTWSATGASNYDVRFGTTTSPPFVATATNASYTTSPLSAGTTYYWQIVARNSAGTTTGPVWSFTTATATGSSSVSDTFTGADGTALASHQPDSGGGWIDDQAGLQLMGNRVSSRQLFGEARSHNATVPSNADYEVSMDIIWSGTTSSTTLGVVGRGTGSQFRSDGYSAYYDASRNRWELIKLVGYGTTSLGTYAQTYTPGQTHTLKLRMVGTAITVYVDGVSRISVTDSSISARNNGGLYARYGAENTSMVGDNYLMVDVGSGTSQPPSTPTSPNPANGSTGVSNTPTLTWSAAGASTYDVQFGTSSPPPVVVANQTAASYTPAPLNAATTYYWQIVARNSSGATPGPVWSFATAAAAGSSSVSDTFTGANGTALASHLPDTGGAWIDDQAGLQLAGNRVTSRQFFGDARSHNATVPSSADYEVSMDIVWSGATSSTILGVVGRGAGAQFRADGYTAYYDASRNRWELIKLVGYGATTLGTYAQTYTQGQTHALKLRMVGTAITVFVDGVSRISVTDSSISARNNAGLYAQYGAENTSMVGDNFLVVGVGAGGGGIPPPPGTPTSPNPANGSNGVSTTPTLTWSATDASTYDVRFGTTTSPPLVATATNASYTTNPLTAGTTYYWQIVAYNSAGSTTGPVWAFTTTSASLVSDTFTGADGTALASHLPEKGGGWIDDQAGLQLTGNRVTSRQFFGDARSHNATAPSTADYEVSMDIIWSGATSSTILGVVGRGGGAQFRSDGYTAYYDASRNRWELIKLVGFGETILGTYAQTYTPGQTHALKLRMVGTAITVFVDGVSRISVTDSSISAINRAGVYAHYGAENTSIVGDNFDVR